MKFLNPTGRSSYGIALCARCSRKFFLDQLQPDPNYPGLMVCADDLDLLDPYRLPPRTSEIITLEFVRPDVPLYGDSGTEVTPVGPAGWMGVRGVGAIGGWYAV